ncbi:MAG: hypothetical protein CBC28_08365 [Flavobacteriaceae bacterium TMED68]|nr:MAG: hypothetical protein CBC28_08365 [Flavobacteriaceae bacterium TMED68]
MNFLSLIKPILAISVIVICFFLSCDKDYHSVGVDLLTKTTLKTRSFNAPVYSYQKKLNYFQTDGLPLGQLGRIQIPGFGVSKASITSQLRYSGGPVFGNYTQEAEVAKDNPAVIDENEKVTSVYLDIPFFNNLDDADQDGVIDLFDNDAKDPESDSDGDGLSDIEESRLNLNPLSDDSDNDGILDLIDTDSSSFEYENNIYQIDSIFGNRAATFNLKVYELTYFLSPLDPLQNFERNKQYYSNTDFFEQGFIGAKLCDTLYSLNFDELRFNYKEDDPETNDVDERNKIQTRLSPRIRVPLDIDFFQTKIIDNEGEDHLSNYENFTRFFKGIVIRADNFSDDLYMLLDINNANINIEYDYNFNNSNGTLDNTSDDIIEINSKVFSLNFNGVRFNTLNHQDMSGEIDKEVQLGQNNIASKKSYLNGNGYFSTIKLFDKLNSQGELLDDLRNNRWLVSEANLFLYVDQDHYISSDLDIIKRLYLFNYSNGSPIIDFTLDNSVNNNQKNKDKFIYGGFLEYDDLGRPYRYKFRITNHVNRLIRKDSTNYTIAISPANGINSIGYKRAQTSDQEFINYPSTSVLSPLGVVLHGSGGEEMDSSKIQLEIFYTEY